MSMGLMVTGRATQLMRAAHSYLKRERGGKAAYTRELYQVVGDIVLGEKGFKLS